ncbi:MAG: Rrf2 family transcriptional regulator [Alphaproteobacteria bacterium]|nr:Rrf2 family transcriptional regulator [Alphaproteobacteria bacterium]
MRLNRASDFALRILILLAKSDEEISIDVISERLSLPKSHVMKIVAQLSGLGFVATQRGRGGGVKLDTPADQINVGQVVRQLERDFAVVDCLAESGPACVFEPRCALKPAMLEATEAFLGVLENYTLGEIVKGTQAPRVAKAG